MSFYSKFVVCALAAGALFTAACGKQSEDSASAEVKIPVAPDAAVQTILSEISNGNGGILWQALPASYQSDVNALVQLVGTKIDPEIYDKSFVLLGRIGDIVLKQKAFIMGTSLGSFSDEEAAQFEKALPSFAQIIEIITTSEIASSSGLQVFDGQAFCETTVSKVLQYLSALPEMSDEEFNFSDISKVTVSVVEATDTDATLEVTVPGEPAVVKHFTKVENCWLPSDMARDWANGFEQAKADLAAMSPEEMAANKPQILSVLAMVNGVLTQIEAAETQEQFDQSIQAAMMPLMGLMMMSQGMGGGTAAPAAPMPAAPAQLPAQ